MSQFYASVLAALFLFAGTIDVNARSRSTMSNKSLLWKISGKDLNKPSYLFGTMHIICPEDYIWTKKMEDALAKADEVCFELDWDAPTMMLSPTNMPDPSGKTLEDHFGKENYKKVADYMRDSLGADIAIFNTMHPNILLVLFSNRSAQCKITLSYEERISEKAKIANKNIIGLETSNEQIALLGLMPIDSTIKDILDIVNGERDDSEHQKLVAAYKTQDLPALDEMVNKNPELSGNKAEFVDNRNIKWIPSMIEMMDQKAMFFAVGAGHLWGENGVINLLRKEGYTVTPVK